MIFYHVESGITSLIEGDARTLSCLNNGMTGLAYGVSLRVAHPFLSNFHVNNTSDRCHGNNRSNYNMYIHDVAEASKLIVSRYIAESITTDAGRFGHVGLCQLRTKQVQVLYAVDKGPKYVSNYNVHS